jgi:tRNA(fMet)-specific endonuclease VapC
MNRYLLDTNAVIALLSGNSALNALIANAEWVGISVITKLEFLSFPGIQEADIALFAEFESRVDVIDIANSDLQLINQSVRYRHEKNLKLPDALIIAAGSANQAMVLTADRQLLNQFPEQTMAFDAACPLATGKSSS